jgi:DNA repair protein RadC
VSAFAIASELLDRFGSLDRLAGAGDAELLGVAGIGPTKLAALRAAFEVGCRAVEKPLRLGSPIRSPAQVHAHFAPRLRGLRQEVFVVLLLDSRHRVLRIVEISRGSLNQSLVHPREVFAPALRESAAAILALHNHPSGDPTPSREDHEVTRRLARAGEVLGVPLLDHIVVAAGGFASFADRGWIPDQGGKEADR